MVRSADLIDALPRLRRYAEALVGGQALADALVERSLEALLAGQAAVPPDGVALAMFAAFDRTHDEAFAGLDPLGRALRAAAARHREPVGVRKAVLLVGLGRLPIDQAAAVLGQPRAVVVRHVAAARDRLRRGTRLRVLLLEDESVSALSMSQALARMGHTVAVAASRLEALALAEARRPELLIADLRLRDGDTGARAVREIRARRRMPVIIATGAPEQAAGDPSLADGILLAKPFGLPALAAAIRRATGADA